MITDILQKILLEKKREVEHCSNQKSVSEIKRSLKDVEPPRDFLAAINKKIANDKSAVIAEIKKASPSKGLIRKNFNPGAIAKSYEAHGAACISILTDKSFFQGSLKDLMLARAATRVPIIRKDFIVDSYQIAEARLAGADCILLIAAALEKNQMKEFEEEAISYGMSVLVEVHNMLELEQALNLKTPLIGINNRNLRTFETDIQVTLNMVKDIPSNKIIITESGIHSKSDVEKLTRAGVRGFLVGEAFMREADPGLALAQIFDF